MFTNLAILGASHCNFCGFCSALSVDLTVSPPAKRHLTRREICGSAMWKICASLRDGHVSFHSECWGNTVSLYIYKCVNMYIYIHTYFIYIYIMYIFVRGFTTIPSWYTKQRFSFRRSSQRLKGRRRCGHVLSHWGSKILCGKDPKLRQIRQSAWINVLDAYPTLIPPTSRVLLLLLSDSKMWWTIDGTNKSHEAFYPTRP